MNQFNVGTWIRLYRNHGGNTTNKTIFITIDHNQEKKIIGNSVNKGVASNKSMGPLEVYMVTYITI